MILKKITIILDHRNFLQNGQIKFIYFLYTNIVRSANGLDKLKIQSNPLSYVELGWVKK